jgi:hypothetical protein
MLGVCKPGTEWNGMKFTFQENKKPGMERNGMDNKCKFTILVLYGYLK